MSDKWEMTDDEVRMVMSSTNSFSQHFFLSPLNPSKPFTAFPYQVKLFDVVDYGYDMHAYAEDGLKPTIPVRYVILLSPRQYGKTVGIVNLATSLACRTPNQKIGILSMRADKAEKLVKEICYNIKKAGFPKDFIVQERKEWVILGNNTEIFSYGATEAIRGEALTWLIIDEAAAPAFDEKIFEAALPTVEIAGAHTNQKFETPSVIFTSTPRGHDNIFLEWYLRGLNNREVGCRSCGYKRRIQHEDFKGIKFSELSIPEDMPPCPKCGNVDYRYVHNYVASIRVDPFQHPFKTKEEIMDEVHRRGNTPMVRQELLGEIVSGELGVFRETWLRNCLDINLYNDAVPKKGNRYVMGVDYGKNHDATVICVGHLNKDNMAVLDHIYYMEAEGSGLSYKDIRFHFLRLVTTYKPYLVVLDATGLGDPLVEVVKDDIYDLKYNGVTVYTSEGRTRQEHFFPAVFDLSTKIYSNLPKRLGYVFTAQSKEDIISNAQKMLMDGRARIPDETLDNATTQLWKELKRFGYQYSTNGRIKYGTQSEHDDCVIAYALLLWGLQVRKYRYTTPSIGGKDIFNYRGND